MAAAAVTKDNKERGRRRKGPEMNRSLKEPFEGRGSSGRPASSEKSYATYYFFSSGEVPETEETKHGRHLSSTVRKTKEQVLSKESF